MERRAALRHPVLWRARWDCDGKSQTVGVRNLSTFGAGVVGLLPLGRRGVLRVLVDGESYDLTSLVVWTDPTSGLSGVRFLFLSDAERLRIAQLDRLLLSRRRKS